MAKWVTEQLETLLHNINEVPYTDDRESRQLSLLMLGFAQLNNQAMSLAAVKIRSQMRVLNLDDVVEASSIKSTRDDDSSADELTRLRPIR